MDNDLDDDDLQDDDWFNFKNYLMNIKVFAKSKNADNTTPLLPKKIYDLSFIEKYSPFKHQDSFSKNK